jgi:hypothetical protein
MEERERCYYFALSRTPLENRKYKSRVLFKTEEKNSTSPLPTWMSLKMTKGLAVTPDTDCSQSKCNTLYY